MCCMFENVTTTSLLFSVGSGALLWLQMYLVAALLILEKTAAEGVPFASDGVKVLR